jgi:hypothetical protein
VVRFAASDRLIACRTISDLRSSWRHDTHDFGIRSEFTVNFRLTTHALNSRAYSERCDFKHESVTWHHRPAESGLFDSSEQHKLLVAVFDFSQRQHSADLGQSFHDKNSGHYWSARKMALKEMLVDTYLFDSDYAFTRYQLNYAINQQERIAVR